MSKMDAQLLIRLKQDELEQIQMNARACEKTTSAYIREIATNICILNLDYSYIMEHTRAISSFRNAINQLIFTIIKTGDYTPVDLEYILDKTQAILKSEKEFLEKYDSFANSCHNLIRRRVRQMVKKSIEGNIESRGKRKGNNKSI